MEKKKKRKKEGNNLRGGRVLLSCLCTGSDLSSLLGSLYDQSYLIQAQVSLQDEQEIFIRKHGRFI